MRRISRCAASFWYCSPICFGPASGPSFSASAFLTSASPVRPALATDRVRYVGDPVAIVIAETPAEARDAAEAVMLDIDPLDAVTEASAAAAPGAPQLYDDVPGNVVLDWHSGDAEKVAAAFATAAHRVKLPLRNNRIVVAAMEPRAAIAEYDAESGRYTLRACSQGVFGLRRQIAELDLVTSSPTAAKTLADNYTGLPLG